MNKLENFKTTKNSLFSSYYEKYNDDVLDKLKVYFVSDDETHIDAFSIKGNYVFCDISLVEKFKLSDMECYACIAHEVGHFISPSKDVLSDPTERELFADRYVTDLGLGSLLISALTKMCPDDELTKLRIKKLNNAS